MNVNTDQLQYDRRKYHPSKENLQKIAMSMQGAKDLQVKIVCCPICLKPLMKVYEDRAGHVSIKCNKCKFNQPLDLRLFRRQKRHPARCTRPAHTAED